jgi:hypothetical protein
MSDELVTRLRETSGKYDEYCWHSDIELEAADRIELLEYALRSIAETPIGAEIPDRTTIWGLATYMHETAKDALKGGTDEQ